ENYIDDCNILVSTKLVDTVGYDGQNLIFQNIGFLTHSNNFNFTKNQPNVFFFNCRFQRGTQDAFSIKGRYTAYLLDCVAAHASKDGFNYHAATTSSQAIEINGI